ncbi:hypothetical protein [Streptomyces rubiginosohelvolus]|uniref:hypothetical protein n=1 Tax=Streptomyces rubiginosohelvolus TaxID=67362 RepID=UPI0035DAA44B
MSLVVLNTMDDRLGKEQKLGDGAWRIKQISGLESLLRAARAGGMTVLITSDHGGVIERHGSRADAPDGTVASARHRLPGESLSPSEVKLRSTGGLAQNPVRASSHCATTTPATRR